MLFKKIERDERATYIENQSYKYGCLVFNFGLLLDIIYRSIRFNEAPWDLFGLIFLAGAVTTGYQYRKNIFEKEWKKTVLILMVITAVSGFLAAMILGRVIK